jgi:hypothetical protein
MACAPPPREEATLHMYSHFGFAGEARHAPRTRRLSTLQTGGSAGAASVYASANEIFVSFPSAVTPDAPSMRFPHARMALRR